MKNDYKVSVIVPTYKRHYDLLKSTIESLLVQTYQNIEIIIVDDNAKLDLIDYRNEVASFVDSLNSEKIILLQNGKNLGGALSRNQGIDKATGDYITFLDDDDMYEPVKIERQLDYVMAHQLDMCFSDLSIFNENGRLTDYRCHDDLLSFDKDYLLKYHLTKQITGTPTFMVKKEVLIDIHGFDDAIMGQEFYLMYKIINSGCKIGYFNQSNIMVSRTNREAISTGPNKIKGEKILYAFKKSHFNLLSFREKNFVICRHFAVLAVSYYRNRKLFFAIYYLGISFLSNPFLAIKEAVGLKKRERRYSK